MGTGSLGITRRAVTSPAVQTLPFIKIQTLEAQMSVENHIMGSTSSGRERFPTMISRQLQFKVIVRGRLIRRARVGQGLA